MEDVTPEARSALVDALHKVFMASKHASGPGLPALVDGVIAAGWRPREDGAVSAEDAGFSDYCTCGHYADWHKLLAGCFASQFRCVGAACSCEDFVSMTPARKRLVK